MSWFSVASGKRGRSPQFSDAAIQFCLTIKNLLAWPCARPSALCNRCWLCLGYRSLFRTSARYARRQRSLDVQATYQPSSDGLHLLLYSTGIKFLGEGEWKCKKYGAERRRQWRELHIGANIRVAILNRFTKLGCPKTAAVG